MSKLSVAKEGIVAVDLFCGAGGLTRGLLDAGIEVKKGFDNVPKLKDTFEKNNPGAEFFCRDISDLTGEEVLEGIDRNEVFLLLAGCAPCQPFSSLLRDGKKRDVRKNLLIQFGRLISEIRPDFVFVENVPGLKNGKGKRIFKQFENILTKEGYFFVSDMLDAKNYGIPQKRRRLVLLASLHCEISIPTGAHGRGKDKLPYVTVREAISKYPRIKAGGADKIVANHITRSLREINLERLRHIRKNGGTRHDLPERLKLDCHKNHDGHTDVYGRMKWDQYAPALTCKCTSISNGRFGHPSQLRGISIREAAALQTFKDDYVFYGNSLTDNTKWVGNAVPPLFARKIIEPIVNISNSLRGADYAE
jgi:DNA (cytosine-5)-methyltransferase 1